MREEPSQDDSSTSPTSPMTSSLSATVPDPLMRLERARVIDTYTAALKDADTKALTLFENVSVQVQRSLNSSARLYSAILIVVTIILAISVYIALFVDAKAHPLTPYYSVIALLAGLIVLIVLIFRNPLRNTHYLVENLVRLNVVFLGFVRRIHQNDPDYCRSGNGGNTIDLA